RLWTVIASAKRRKGCGGSSRWRAFLERSHFFQRFAPAADGRRGCEARHGVRGLPGGGGFGGGSWVAGGCSGGIGGEPGADEEERGTCGLEGADGFAEQQPGGGDAEDRYQEHGRGCRGGTSGSH